MPRSELFERPPERGWVVPVGGAEKKVRSPRVLGRFAEVCGGEDARIAVISTASSLPDTGERYVKIFDNLGVHADVLPFEAREDGRDPRMLSLIEEADGLWMTGGNQMRLATVISGTAAHRLIVDRNRAGMHVGGTSAGAAILSEHMIAVGAHGPTPRRGIVTMATGFGLLHDVIVDQHFRERDRLGRLMTAISFSPASLGLGVDEDTGAFIAPDDTLTVVGSGGVTVVDASDVTDVSLHETRAGRPVRLTDLRLHVLIDGDRFDLKRRRPLPRET